MWQHILQYWDYHTFLTEVRKRQFQNKCAFEKFSLAIETFKHEFESVIIENYELEKRKNVKTENCEKFQQIFGSFDQSKFQRK